MGDGWSAVSSITDVVLIGDIGIPTEIELRRESLDGVAPEVVVAFQAQNSVPQCTSVELYMVDGGREVRPQDLRDLDLPALLERVFIEHSVKVRNVKPGHVVVTPAHNTSEVTEARRAVRGARKGRTPRRITENLLRQVAETYLSPPTGIGPRAAVERRFNVGPRMAAEYIARCRAHQPPLLPPVKGKNRENGAADGKSRKKA